MQLPAIYASALLEADAIAQGLESGALVRDERLAAVLDAGTAHARTSFEMRRMLRTGWQQLLDLTDAVDSAHELASRARRAPDAPLRLQRAEHCRREAEMVARVQAQEDELARLERESGELAETLRIIQTSAIMRASAPVRRMYYRMRGGFRLR